ncbi:hypothetical protein NIE88_12635 [Sporolactobacillus shoreicorticis]|uniref:Uncharacterized protein n=1 Tax=Sporolactobacillus shoreicorticis TaxID=1923877 RepID=A0ABW5S6T7_9BACL|nr:hypothetical protein [Sporolactobacillus shoreicorticis]MCO7126611.1 hypothetical protein [Sporolactobacillus shoreicorticis]
MIYIISAALLVITLTVSCAYYFLSIYKKKLDIISDQLLDEINSFNKEINGDSENEKDDTSNSINAILNQYSIKNDYKQFIMIDDVWLNNILTLLIKPLRIDEKSKLRIDLLATLKKFSATISKGEIIEGEDRETLLKTVKKLFEMDSINSNGNYIACYFVFSSDGNYFLRIVLTNTEVNQFSIRMGILQRNEKKPFLFNKVPLPFNDRENNKYWRGYFINEYRV